MKFLYGIICEKAIISQRTDQLSVINIIENFNVRELPTAYPNISIVLSWERDADTLGAESSGKARLRRDPTVDSAINGPIEFDVVIPSDKKALRLILDVGAIVLQEAGENKLVIDLKHGERWSEVGNINFNINHNPTPEDTITTPTE